MATAATGVPSAAAACSVSSTVPSPSWAGASLGVPPAAQRMPPLLERARHLRAAHVLGDQRLPERAARAQLPVPGEPMEPQQEVLGRGGGIGPLLAQRRAVLADGIAAGRG